ncbi:hypothetical protein ACKWTF_015425 [Chironomus riparius]
MMRTLNFIVIIISFITIAESFDLSCNYDKLKYPPFGSFYRCKVQINLNITSKLISTVRSANGAHNTATSNADVMSFTADRKNIQYFPKGLPKVFKNLKVITILYGRLKEVTPEDLMPFKELLILNLMGNDLEVLQKDIFTSNTHLTQIYLNDNKLIHIDENVFTMLHKLTHLNLKINLCIDSQAINNATAVRKVIQEAQSLCNAEEYLGVEEYFRHYEDKLICINSETIPIVDGKLEEIRGIIAVSKLSKSVAFRDKLDMLKNWKEHNIWSVKNTTDAFEALLMNHSNKIMTKIEAGDEKLKSSLINHDVSLEKIMDRLSGNMSFLGTNLMKKIDNLQEIMNYTSDDQITLINNLEDLIMLVENNVKNQMASEQAELKYLHDKISNLKELIEQSNGQVNSLEAAVKESAKHIKNQTTKDLNMLHDKISSIDTFMRSEFAVIKSSLNSKMAASEKSLTDKIDNLERILRHYISSDARTMSNFQSNVDERLKVQNYKIDKSSGIQDYTQSVLVTSCAFLVSLIIYIAYKKFLLRMMLVEQEMDGIY